MISWAERSSSQINRAKPHGNYSTDKDTKDANVSS